MKDELFQELLASVKQGAAIIKGTLQPIRSFAFPGEQVAKTNHTLRRTARAA